MLDSKGIDFPQWILRYRFRAGNRFRVVFKESTSRLMIRISAYGNNISFIVIGRAKEKAANPVRENRVGWMDCVFFSRYTRITGRQGRKTTHERLSFIVRNLQTGTNRCHHPKVDLAEVI